MKNTAPHQKSAVCQFPSGIVLIISSFSDTSDFKTGRSLHKFNQFVSLFFCAIAKTVLVL